LNIIIFNALISHVFIIFLFKGLKNVIEALFSICQEESTKGTIFPFPSHFFIIFLTWQHKWKDITSYRLDFGIGAHHTWIKDELLGLEHIMISYMNQGWSHKWVFFLIEIIMRFLFVILSVSCILRFTRFILLLFKQLTL
jgi:hypothetical protein